MVQAGGAAVQQALKKKEAKAKAKAAQKEAARLARSGSSSAVEVARDDPANPAVKATVSQNAPKRPNASTKSLAHSKSMTLSKEYLPLQNAVRQLYERTAVQMGVAGLIFGNFIVSACNAEVWEHIDPAGTEDKDTPGEFVFYGFEIFFNSVFAIELFVNMYGKFPCSFWKDPWNVFDFVIVWVSLLSMVAPNVPGVSTLRLFRSFRVFRLFKRIKQLKLIIEAVMKSLPGVCNAFVVLLLIMSIWAIIAVQFFREDEQLGITHFGDFFRALITFFQIMTFDGWCSSVARQLILEQGVVFAGFFITYVFVNSIMMTNVVVAILLEKFIKAQEELKARDEEEALALLHAHDHEDDFDEDSSKPPAWHRDADVFEAEMLYELRLLAREFDDLQQDLDSLQLGPQEAAGVQESDRLRAGLYHVPVTLAAHPAPEVPVSGCGAGPLAAGFHEPPAESGLPELYEAFERGAGQLLKPRFSENSGEAAGELLRVPPPDPPEAPDVSTDTAGSLELPSAPEDRLLGPAS